jgi:hypothetical protein
MGFDPDFSAGILALALAGSPVRPGRHMTSAVKKATGFS